ncbi:MAG: phenylalanine--tRNA ligase subunit alpha [Acidobacteriota bacterium]
MSLFQESPHPLWEEFQRDLESVSAVEELGEIRDKYLSRHRGLISLQLRDLGSLPREERPAAGQRLNQLKLRVEESLSRRQSQLAAQEQAISLEKERIDVTLPGYSFPQGGIHPLRRVQEEMEEIAVRMGFTVVSGPELEQDYYNFEALNIPKGHPARDAQDTLYITENLLLRTHTSPVQIRTMEKSAPPIRIVVPGRVFRRDAVDATHSPMFHQLEGLVVDEGITLADLKGTLDVFLKELFSADTRIRLRPSYFPFVEPGAEADISCIFCAGAGCRVCKRTGWIEVLGAGMVHPRILEMVGYDPEKYTGFAWGMGIDRIAILKYQIDDMRLFFENDIRFLRQFL